ncbi:MAG: hypothetical protein ACUVRD_00375 [Bacteroidia bacterium]
MKVLKAIIGLALGALLGLLIAGSLAIYLARKQIQTWLLDTLQKALSAQIVIDHLSWNRSWRHLPYLEITLHGTQLILPKADTLLRAQKVGIGLDIWDFFLRRKYTIALMSAQNAQIRIRCGPKGCNYDRLFSSSGDSSAWALKRLYLSATDVIYQTPQLSVKVTFSQAEGEIRGHKDTIAVKALTWGHLHHLRHKKTAYLTSMPFKLTGHLQYAQNLLQLEAQAVLKEIPLEVQGHWQGKQSQLTFRAERVSLRPWLKKYYPEAPFQMEGYLSATGQWNSQHKIPLQAQWHISDLSLEADSFPHYRGQAQGIITWQKKLFVEVQELFLRSCCDSVRGSFRFEEPTFVEGNLILEGLFPPFVPKLFARGFLKLRFEGTQVRTRWRFQGTYHIDELRYEQLHLRQGALRFSDNEILLHRVRGQYDGLAFQAEGKIQNWPYLLDSTVAEKLIVKAQLHLPRFRIYTPTGTQKNLPPYTLYAETHIDTLEWPPFTFHDVRAQIFSTAESTALALEHATAAGATWQGSLYQGKRLTGEVTFRRLQLQKLYASAPMWDSLVPFMRYLRGACEGNLQYAFPLGGRWSQAWLSGQIQWDSLQIVESPYTYKLWNKIQLVDLRNAWIGRVRTRFSLRDGVFRLEPTTLTTPQWHLRLEGWHTWQGEMGYKLWARLLPKAQASLPVEEIAQTPRYVEILLKGNLDNPDFSWKLHYSSEIRDSLYAPPKRKQKTRAWVEEE